VFISSTSLPRFVSAKCAAKLVSAAHHSDWSEPPPTPVFIFGTRLFALFAQIRAALAPPPLTLFDLYLGFMRSQARRPPLTAPTGCRQLLLLLKGRVSACYPEVLLFHRQK